MKLAARSVVRLGIVAVVGVALVFSTSAAGNSTGSHRARVSVPLTHGNPCEPLHDYKTAACDKAWQAWKERQQVSSPAQPATPAAPASQSRCAPLHDYKSGDC
jgi:hypothetical protein